jgi:diketogulonate reductase-like aldo/keto reductase
MYCKAYCKADVAAGSGTGRERRAFLKAAAAIGAGTWIPALAQAKHLKRTIPSSGEQIAAIGLGTWQAFDVARDPGAKSQAREALKLFAQMGGEMIDSSPMYGSSESVAGELCAELGLHRRLFVATKVWTRGRAEGIAQMNDSMRKLRTELKGALDLMQVHNLLDAATHLATLREWKKEGRVRYIGITHYHAGAHADLEAALDKGGIDFIQVNYSLAEPEAGRRLLDAARGAGAAVIVNRPFAEGALFSRVAGRAVPAFAADIGCRSWAQLFLKWIVSHPAVTCVIPGTRDPRHVADNLGALSGPLPDAALRKRIGEALAAP